jgi:crotonobetainyl-CoA:carnitine CoA-transferase CaiB-like acyl-CoA transferase
MESALTGITVLEFGNFVTGPYASMLLGDMGARVIKVEEPTSGDHFRHWSETGDAFSPTFCSLNRNKESVAIDLTTVAGKEIALKLCQCSDVLVENFRPRVMDRFGLGYEHLQRINPNLVYCSISAFGQDGPDWGKPGYDTIGQALSGLLSLLTDPEDPKPTGISLSDHITGVFACYGILTALVRRFRGGGGQRVDTSLLRASVSFTGENAARYFSTKEIPSRKTRTHLAQAYAFKDQQGKPFVVHLSSLQKFWIGLTDTLGRPDLTGDNRFVDRSARVKNYEELHQILQQEFTKRNREEIVKTLQEHDVPCAPINRLDEVFIDRQVQHLGMRQTIKHPVLGGIDLVANAVSLSATPAGIRLPPPLLGEHTDPILEEIGYSKEDTMKLREQGIIR